MISTPLHFNKDVVLLDVSVNPKQDEEIFLNNKNLIPYFRIGLSLIGNKNITNQLTICRKGLIKLFPFHEDLLEISNLYAISKILLQIIIKPCELSLQKGKFKIKQRLNIRIIQTNKNKRK